MMCPSLMCHLSSDPSRNQPTPASVYLVYGCVLVTVCCHYFLQSASLQTESSLLKEQIKQLDNQNTSLNNQMVSLQRHTTTLQDLNSALHTKTAQLQVPGVIQTYSLAVVFPQTGLISVEQDICYRTHLFHCCSLIVNL